MCYNIRYTFLKILRLIILIIGLEQLKRCSLKHLKIFGKRMLEIFGKITSDLGNYSRL